MVKSAKSMDPKRAEQAIRDLAARHQMDLARTSLDDWADEATRLTGTGVSLDEVEELIVGLRKAGAVDGIELTRLHSRYLDERSTN